MGAYIIRIPVIKRILFY